jgi:archaellum biogenesis ATPase FlaH
MLVFSSLFLLISSTFVNSSYAGPGNSNQDIDKRVLECVAKLNAVCNKELLFTESMKDSNLKKKYYLKLMNNFQMWLEQSKVILTTLQPDEVQQNVSDLTHVCQDYFTKITEYLYWVQGKSPPGGFSMTDPDTYYEDVIHHK